MKFLKEIAFCLLLTNHLLGQILPNDGSIINYTQVFFIWDQIPHAENYKFIINDITNNLHYEVITHKNSILIDDFLNWGANYNWYNCGQLTINDSIICSDQINCNLKELLL